MRSAWCYLPSWRSTIGMQRTALRAAADAERYVKRYLGGFMIWSVINFGTHKGKTLPQVLFSDPVWFFWAIEEGVFQNRGTLRGQAADLNTCLLYTSPSPRD